MLFRKSPVMSYVYGENFLIQNWALGKGGLQTFTDVKSLVCSDFLILPSDPTSFCTMRTLKVIYLIPIWKEAFAVFEREHKNSAYFRKEVLPKVKNALLNHAAMVGGCKFSEVVVGWEGAIKVLEGACVLDKNGKVAVSIREQPFGTVFETKAVVSNIGLCDERFCANIALKHAKDYNDFVRIMDMHGATSGHLRLNWNSAIKMMRGSFLSSNWIVKNIIPQFEQTFTATLDDLKDKDKWYNALIDALILDVGFKQFNLDTLRS